MLYTCKLFCGNLSNLFCGNLSKYVATHCSQIVTTNAELLTAEKEQSACHSTLTLFAIVIYSEVK
jgi:hypothetical protein